MYNLDLGNCQGYMGLQYHYEYTDLSYKNKTLELCYFKQMFDNYKNMICPIIPITINIDEYHKLINWILQKFKDLNVYRKFYGIDTLINGIILTNKRFLTNRQPSILPKINPNFIYTSFNMSLFQHITSNHFIEYEYILDNELKYNEINTLFYEYLTDINIDFYPISIIISYIYLQLKHELKSITIGTQIITFDKNFFIDLCIQIIFWFIQPVPFHKNITIYDIVIFSTIKLLSTKSQIEPKIVIENKLLIPIFTMNIEKYKDMMIYYDIQHKSMDFKKYHEYNFYYNKNSV
jgi:hypothetical protein